MDTRQATQPTIARETAGTKSHGISSIDVVEIEANEIWKKCKKMRTVIESADNDANAERLAKEIFDKLYESHREFTISYPLVLRHMVYEGIFYPKILHRYLVKVAAETTEGKWKSEDDFLMSQVNYGCMLQRQYMRDNHATQKCINENVNHYRKAAFDKLKKESADTKCEIKELRRKFEETQAADTEVRRKELIDFIKAGLAQSATQQPTPSLSDVVKNVMDTCDTVSKNIQDAELVDVELSNDNNTIS